MAQQTINAGPPYTGAGDLLAIGWAKANANFAEVYSLQSRTLSAADPRFADVTIEGTINNAINLPSIGAIATGSQRVVIPSFMLTNGYDANLAGLSTLVRMTREGGNSTDYDLQAYGAVPNGTADGRASVLGALTIAQANGSGRIYAPGAPLAYRLSGQYTLPAPINIDGDPGGATTLIWLDNPAPALLLNNSPPPGGIPSTQRYGWGLRGLKLQPAVAQQGTALQLSTDASNLSIGARLQDVDVVSWGIGFRGGVIPLFLNCRFLDCTQSFVFDGTPAGNGERVVFMGCAFSQGVGAYANNLLITAPFTDVYFVGCSFDNVQLAMNTDVTSRATCIGCHFENPPPHGLSGGVSDLPCIVLAGTGALDLLGCGFSQDVDNPTMLGYISQTGGRLTINGGTMNHAGNGTLAAMVNQTGGTLIVPSFPVRRNTTKLVATAAGNPAGDVLSPLHVDISSPGALALGNNNDYAVIEQAGTYRLTPNAGSSVITGVAMVGGNVPGRRARFVHISGNGGTITLSHNDANSAVGNRLLCNTSSNIVLFQHGIADLEFDGGTNAWRVR